MQETADILSKFTAGSLYDDCCALLRYLKVSFVEVTAMPVPFSQLYPTAMPRGLSEVADKVAATYYIGQIDSRTLVGEATAMTTAEVQRLVEQGKYEGMLVFAADIKEGEHLTRSEMALLTRGFNRIATAQPVVLFLRQGCHLSLATCERMDYTQQWRDGEKLGKVSILRDIDCHKPHHGHIDILETLGDKSYATFDELYEHWMEVFSTDVLTRKFYGELSDWYAWASQVVRFPNDISTNTINQKLNQRYNSEACIRLITRLIFVWFIYRKRLIPGELFDEEYIRQNLIAGFSPRTADSNKTYNPEASLYYRLILQNLFFATLNCPINTDGKGDTSNRGFVAQARYHGISKTYDINNLMRYEADFTPGGPKKLLNLVNSRVPFLNGGLFECLDKKDKGLYFDGFSERKVSLSRLYVPDWLFFGGTDDADLSQWFDNNKKKHIKVKGLIDLFKQYYFTVEESTPLEQEVSLDPELLGKAFENLLAAYVEDTDTSVRKMTGSFYTPRPIVQYMVDESLVAHLKRICGEEHEQTYRALLSYSDNEIPLSDELRHSIMEAIYNCRVLDPACGSGAFPMGMLQQMVHILRRIDPTNSMWKEFLRQRVVEHADDAFSSDSEEERHEQLADMEEAFNKGVNDPDYARKLYIIEHCIHGVDLQTTAVQISKLRFFISLIVDQKPTSDARQNFGIRPLPNLEAKFVAANTLIPISYDRTLVDSIPEVERLKQRLKDLNHRLFLIRRHSDKKKLEQDIKETRARLTKVIADSGFVDSGVAAQLASWDMFDQNTSSDFFDPEWMFGVKGGFDIVIGNPPYVQIKKLSLKRLYKIIGFATFDSTGDLYCLFYEIATKLLAKDKKGNGEAGTAVFITSNKWLKSNYGEATRKFLIKNSNPIKLIDLGPGVFDAAVDTCILVWSNHKYTGKTKFATISNYFDTANIDFENISLPNIGIWNAESLKYSAIRNKIEAISTRLSNFGVELDYGILTGANKTFILSEEKANYLLSLNPKNKELIKPILRGQDIGRYYATFNHIYLLCVHNGVKKLGIPPIDIEKDYPTLVPYFNSFGNNFKNRGEQGDTYYNLRNCAYIMKYEEPKIIYADIVQDKGKFYYDEDMYYTNDTAFLISGKNLKYLVGVLNSNAFNFFYKKFYCGSSLGKKGLRFKKDFLLKVPIPIAPQNIKNEVESLSMSAFQLRKINSCSDISSEETRIDFLVYHLYGLTYDEVLVVDPETPITREEYEADSEN